MRFYLLGGVGTATHVVGRCESGLQPVAGKLERMSSPTVDTAVVALRSFVHLSGALRAQAIVPGEPDPALVSCTRLGPIEGIAGGQAVTLPHDIELDTAAPDLGDLRPLPPFDISTERGEVAGMIGGIYMLRDAARAVGAALGPEAGVGARLETTTPDEPLVVSARGAELLVTLGDESFELP